MQLNTRTFISLLLTGVATIYFYYGFRSESIQTNTDTQKPTISAETVETDMGKRLKTYANSGTDWGMSPFGSGKPLTEVEKKPKFQKPNTEWKTRTISGVTYVFGEGNPREVAITTESLKQLKEKCGTISDPDNLGYLCKEMDGYVTPNVEEAILAVLSDPHWEDLLGKCEENLRHNEDRSFTYDGLFHTDFFDINHWITIDWNGKKELNIQRTFQLEMFLYHRTDAWYKETEYPINIPDGSTKKFQNGYDCVDTYGKDIINNLSLAIAYYKAVQ
jgi:hypothetical protein